MMMIKLIILLSLDFVQLELVKAIDYSKMHCGSPSYNDGTDESEYPLMTFRENETPVVGTIVNLFHEIDIRKKQYEFALHKRDQLYKLHAQKMDNEREKNKQEREKDKEEHTERMKKLEAEERDIERNHQLRMQEVEVELKSMKLELDILKEKHRHEEVVIRQKEEKKMKLESLKEKNRHEEEMNRGRLEVEKMEGGMVDTDQNDDQSCSSNTVV